MKSTHLTIAAALAVLLFTLAACGESPTPTSTSAPAPTATATVPPPTSTPTATSTPVPTATHTPTATPSPTPTPTPNPLSVAFMRQQEYPGSDFTFEQTLAPGSNYARHVVSYQSDGFKIYALLTVPNGTKPASGWPVIIFNHGYIPPAQYRTTERYVAYVDAFARNGYIVLKSDYRGHGSSEGAAAGGYGSPAYTIDILNALTSLKRFDAVDPNRIGMWGHSMGGHITLRTLVTVPDIKVAVIWAGVVASYPDLFANWRGPTASSALTQRGWRGSLISEYGTPEQNPVFWAAISPNTYVSDISAPVQLHHGTADTSVPLRFSETLAQQLKDAGKSVELYTYAGDDHNISQNFNTAMQRSVAFFNRYLK